MRLWNIQRVTDRVAIFLADRHERDPAVLARQNPHADLGAAFTHLVTAHVLHAEIRNDRREALHRGDLDEIAASVGLPTEIGRERSDKDADADGIAGEVTRRLQRRPATLAVQPEIT